MNMEDERDDQQERVNANPEMESDIRADAQDSGELGDFDVVDVQLAPEAFAATSTSATDSRTISNETGDFVNDDKSLSADPSPEPLEPPPATLPVLDNDGNVPKFTNTLTAALKLWEEAAAEVPGDPLFTPQPTDKPREQLSVYRRSPWGKDVWFDRETMTPVLYDEPPANCRFHHPSPWKGFPPPTRLRTPPTRSAIWARRARRSS